MSDKKTIIAFDLYSTLLSTSSVAQELSLHFGDEKAQSIAELWRRYQLEYTFRMNSMTLYKPFSEITRTSLHHALTEHKLSLPEAAINHIMHSYNSLTLFPDVKSGLDNLVTDPQIIPYIFSNGTYEMVYESINQSPELAGYKQVFKELVTVEEVGCYKPHPRVYEHFVGKVRGGVCGEDTRDWEGVWLVSGNAFDVVGARAVGWQTCWVDRRGAGWVGGWGAACCGEGGG
ncbi:hypothetical protein sscle_04g037420 [Sclerotinia sclerotiorum 1980 UF-70]|uniref:Haloacid dehalogenase, type II n=1 Tax=Sclerotinia sclerotiorum (strain ATCC 18683 / 1980 / Ss-1) TaxID=665079 RepID=A0A1D9Q2B3_SCLS1|nr:hypothetical protein sscle_04g037420 [Sclerotinia sclerotiorum 1980 UF-70]